jgi:hypothetical protein
MRGQMNAAFKSRKLWFVAISCCLLLAACSPFKVTDPSDPRFDPMKFDFNDYRNHKEMAEVLRVLFPVGTPMERVDEILVGVGGGRKWEREEIHGGFSVRKMIDMESLNKASTKIVSYSHDGKNPKFLWQIFTFYDENLQIIQFIIGNEIVFLDGKEGE